MYVCYYEEAGGRMQPIAICDYEITAMRLVRIMNEVYDNTGSKYIWWPI